MSFPAIFLSSFTRPAARLFYAACLFILDKVNRVETRGHVSLEKLGFAHPDLRQYEGSGWRTLERISQLIPFTPNDVFVDFGSGKGRIIYLAAGYPFKRVVGVDQSETLNTIARGNISRNINCLACKDVTVVTSDILDFPIPDDMTIAYFYNPFAGEIFTSVIGRIHASLQRAPRPLWLLYTVPVLHPYLRGQEWIRLVARLPRTNIYRCTV